MNQVKAGLLRGTGSAISVAIGWIPDLVIITNLTDGDRIDFGSPSIQAMPFTSGSFLIKAGQIIKGATSGATAKVLDFIVDSGTLAAGDATGWILLDIETKLGTFSSENVYVSSDSTSGVDDATVTVDVNYSENVVLAVGQSTGNGLITPYVGSSGSASLGFTVGSTISEDAKLLQYVAFRNGPGASSKCDNSL